MKTALVTGSAGFIGYFTAQALLDALTDYYDVTLKEKQHERLADRPDFLPVIGRLESPGLLKGLLAEHAPDLVVHLAAQAGVRYSIDHPASYVQANLVGTAELLDALRAHPPAHSLPASTSSVYGTNTERPYLETHKADTQMSFYAAILALAGAVPDPAAPVAGDSLSPVAPFRVVNIGNGQPVRLKDYISVIEAACGREAEKNFLPAQPGDVPATWADISLLKTLTGFEPAWDVARGIPQFVSWYRDYYRV